MDAYSRYIEICPMKNQSAEAVKVHIKSVCARHGIPEVITTDGGTQLTSCLEELGANLGFSHVISSPRYPQSNGQAESGVKIAKAILTKGNDPYENLMAYRSTPLHNGFSPAQLLMGRQIRTTLPMLTLNLEPSQIPHNEVAQREQARKDKSKEDFDKRHRAVEKKPLQTNERVFITDRQEYGKILQPRVQPRSYVVLGEKGGEYTRNSRHLVRAPRATITPAPPSAPVAQTQAPLCQTPTAVIDLPVSTPKSDLTPTAGRYNRYGRQIKPMKKLNL